MVALIPIARDMPLTWLGADAREPQSSFTSFTNRRSYVVHRVADCLLKAPESGRTAVVVRTIFARWPAPALHLCGGGPERVRQRPMFDRGMRPAAAPGAAVRRPGGEPLRISRPLSYCNSWRG